MKELQGLFAEATVLVNRLTMDIDEGRISLKETEEQVLEFVNRIGALMIDDIVQDVTDPVSENRVWVDGRKALYKGDTTLRFINRFGTAVTRKRRSYHVEGESGRWHPLDEKLGIRKCGGYSPLMTYLLALFGSGDAYEPASKKLSTAMGIGVSATAVQRNTEMIGETLEPRPLRSIDPEKEDTACDLMIVEIDGTTSPQIAEREGITGRESLKEPTEYKECNVLVIKKMSEQQKNVGEPTYEEQDHWVGAMYGKRIKFERYVHEAGISMGQMKAGKTVFIADGAKHNWEIQKTNFCDAVAILDAYHAMEHLGDFCSLYRKESRGKERYGRWCQMMLDGDTLQLLHEMKQALGELKDSDEGQKHINYFKNNVDRMAYDTYKAMGYPIGSGIVEGSCKLVVGKRFKGNGMRWKRKDNKAVLRVRLAVLNDKLEDAFKRRIRKHSYTAPKYPNAA